MTAASYSAADPGNYPVMDYRSADFTRTLMISTRAALTQEQIFALFDIIPGMEYCELQRDSYGMSKGEQSERTTVWYLEEVAFDVFKPCIVNILLLMFEFV